MRSKQPLIFNLSFSQLQTRMLTCQNVVCCFKCISKLPNKLWNFLVNGVDSSKFMNETSIHVFTRIKTNRTPFKRLIWLIISLITFVFCSGQIYLDTQQIIENTFTLNSRQIRDAKEMAPIVLTICSKHWLNWIDFRKVYSHNLTKDEFFALVFLYGNDFNFDQCATIKHLKAALRKIGLDVNGTMNEVTSKLRYIENIKYKTIYFIRREMLENQIEVCIKIIYEFSSLEYITLYHKIKPTPDDTAFKLRNAFELSRNESEYVRQLLKKPIENSVDVSLNDVHISLDNDVYISALIDIEYVIKVAGNKDYLKNDLSTAYPPSNMIATEIFQNVSLIFNNSSGGICEPTVDFETKFRQQHENSFFDDDIPNKWYEETVKRHEIYFSVFQSSLQ